MKTDRLLEEIKSRVDIVEFISDYVTLKKSGQNFKGLCPFHSEKTPSFIVSPSKQIFHCFGCGFGGDIVSFFMKHDNLSFNEAIRYIAKKSGIKITEFKFSKSNQSGKRQKIIQINEDALTFFINNLAHSESAKAYLKKRGIEKDSIEEFRLGYAPVERDSLYKYLMKKGFPDQILKDSGVVVSDEKSGRDLFRKRIIFPIFNIKNDLIAFGGRVIDDSLPKYLNTPETEVFKKGETLFALNLSKDEIRKKGYAVIVEGYLDVIMCHKYGVKNTVAPLGTALSPTQMQKLKMLTKKVVLVFDADEAGISAAKRSLAIIFECDLKAKVLLLPKGEDPDSFLRKNGREPFKKMISNSMSMVNFLLHTLKGDNIDTVKDILSMISNMNDIILADEILRELSDRSRIHESVLRSELQKIKRRAHKKQPSSNSLRAKKMFPDTSMLNKEEYLLLSAIIAFPEKSDHVLTTLDTDELKDEKIKSIFNKMKSLIPHLHIGALLDKADETEQALITELSLHPGFDLENVDKNIHDCLQLLRYRKLEDKRRLAEQKEDVAILDSLLKEKRRLMKRENT